MVCIIISVNYNLLFNGFSCRGKWIMIVLKTTQIFTRVLKKWYTSKRMGGLGGLGGRAGHRAGPWSELEGRVDVGFGCGNALLGSLDVSREGCGRCASVVAALLVGASQSRDGIDDAHGLRLAPVWSRLKPRPSPRTSRSASRTSSLRMLREVASKARSPRLNSLTFSSKLVARRQLQALSK